jgi:hypothetical protein
MSIVMTPLMSQSTGTTSPLTTVERYCPAAKPGKVPNGVLLEEQLEGEDSQDMTSYFGCTAPLEVMVTVEVEVKEDDEEADEEDEVQQEWMGQQWRSWEEDLALAWEEADAKEDPLSDKGYTSEEEEDYSKVEDLDAHPSEEEVDGGKTVVPMSMVETSDWVPDKEQSAAILKAWQEWSAPPEWLPEPTWWPVEGYEPGDTYLFAEGYSLEVNDDEQYPPAIAVY